MVRWSRYFVVRKGSGGGWSFPYSIWANPQRAHIATAMWQMITKKYCWCRWRHNSQGRRTWRRRWRRWETTTTTRENEWTVQRRHLATSSAVPWRSPQLATTAVVYACMPHTRRWPWLAVWCSGNALVSINAVALHRARLVLGRPYTQGGQVQITQCYLQITPCLPLPRKHSPDGAPQTEVADI